MSTFTQVTELANLRRAYRWLLSNPDAAYKNYFRDAYAAYAIASDRNLRLLQRQMRNGRFVPSHASKLYWPKPTGVLRPISLLTVNDQIAYQACVNLVAEALEKHVKRRRYSTVFHHSYAGKTSAFFYRQWQSDYRRFGQSVRRNFADGFVYVATFDLTAFYDSIDHHVLRTFLARLGIEIGVIDFLMQGLRVWTSATWSAGRGKVIYHEHGIPQGPLSSGMLSEAILQHLDRLGDGSRSNVRYLRYVDDIKLMAKDESTLRRRLVSLDIAAKEIGLFPQGSKINIRKISDPKDELKSVSIPPEPAAATSATQATITKRIRELAPRGQVKDATRFRYVIRSLIPSAKTNSLLLKIISKQPHLADAILRHFEKYSRLPKSLSKALKSKILEDGVYHSENAATLNALFGRCDPADESAIADFSYERLLARKYRGRAHPTPQPTYYVALFQWALRSGRMTYRDAENLIAHQHDWWVRQQMLHALPPDKFGIASYELILNSAIHTHESEPARTAAALLFEHALKVSRPFITANWTARVSLRTTGLIPYTGRPPSLLNGILAYVLQRKETPYAWRRLLRTEHDLTEKIGITAKQRYETDIDAFIVSLDSLCEQLLRAIYIQRGVALTTSYGNALTAGSPAWLKTDFPAVRDGFDKLHKLRIRSYTAHPKHTSGKPNRRLKHSQFYRVRKVLRGALDEIERAIPAP